MIENKSYDPYRLTKLYGIYLIAMAVLLLYLVFWPSDSQQKQPLYLPLLVTLYCAYVVAYNILMFSGIIQNSNSYLALLMVETTLFCAVVIHLIGDVVGLTNHVFLGIALTSVLYRGANGYVLAAWITINLFSSAHILINSLPDFSFQFGTTGGFGFLLAFIIQIASRPLIQTLPEYQDSIQEVQRLKFLTSQVIKRMEMGLIVINEFGKPIMSNDASKNLIHTDQLTELPRPIEKAFLDWKKGHRLSTQRVHLEGSAIDLRLSFSELTTQESIEYLLFIESDSDIRLQAQRMKNESLAHLAASVAHEIRNPLSAVSHAGQLVIESPQLDEEDKKLCHIIINQSDRINDIIGRLELLSTKQLSKPEKIELREFCKHFINARKSIDNSKITAQLTGASEVWVSFDPVQLEQIFTNLWENSIRHKTALDNELFIEFIISTRNQSGLPSVLVRDNGPGVPEENIDKLFEPFFTTSHHGKGLGLYICQSLCEYNQARIHYRNEYPGACFEIVFSGPVIVEENEYYDDLRA